MTARKPDPDVELYFKGVYPEKIPVRSLADAVSAIYRLATRPDLAEEEEEDERVSLRLLDIRRSSAIFRCVADDPGHLIEGLRLAGQWLEHPQNADGLASALPAIRRLSEIAGALDCPIIVRRPTNYADVLATIQPQTYQQLAPALLVSGDKTITGVVQRVGGVTDTKCALRVEFQSRLLHCTVRPTEVVSELARYIYQPVVVSGKATWLRRSWQIVDFEIHDVQQPEAGAISEALEALRNAGADAWDSIADPEAYIKEVTGRR
jgi:hypothetical protein